MGGKLGSFFSSVSLLGDYFEVKYYTIRFDATYSHTFKTVDRLFIVARDGGTVAAAVLVLV